MHKHKQKTKSQSWGAWSDWAWDESRRRWYRARQDSNGNFEYDWDNRQTPREIDNLAESFRNLSPGSSFDIHAQDYTLSATSSRTSKSKQCEKRRAHNEKENVGRASMSDASASSPETCYNVYHEPKYTYGSPPSSYYSQKSPASASYPTGSESHAGVHAPIYNQSRHAIQRQSKSTEADEERLRVAASQAMYYGNDRRQGSGSSSSVLASYYPEEEEGPPTPKAHITADEELLEELDPRYRVEHSSKFQPGEIFKVHWSEPQGSSNEHTPSVSGMQEIQNRFGTKFFVGFRRFIVVANDQGHSTCVPILTYGGKGCKKKGVKPAKHGVIHEHGHRARLLDGEPELGFDSVRAELSQEGEKLSKESRVNYSKLVTVEHNVKVFFIGSIVAKDWDRVQEAVNRCWNDKNHHHKKRSK
ncbi:hypothetical protein CDD82_5119 [Ophiocordyceps australis]|uniref:DUF6590 domain-containing protein n=1 Tax=Ophiocordyceps australis TaxID=1399860 RepID=A0A2C5Z4F0_9HYPO|nr:hypothetical protein CDD82_5119 [Ophiocordyceps australis]